MTHEEKHDLELAICQLCCAEQIFTSGGIDLDTFIIYNGLNTQKYLELAEKENLNEKIIKAIKDNI